MNEPNNIPKESEAFEALGVLEELGDMIRVRPGELVEVLEGLGELSTAVKTTKMHKYNNNNVIMHSHVHISLLYKHI